MEKQTRVRLTDHNRDLHGGTITVYAQSPLAVIAAARATRGIPQIRIVLICHFNDSEKYEHGLKFGDANIRRYGDILDADERTAMKLADAVIAPSQWLADILRKRHPTDASKIVLVHNGVPDIRNILSELTPKKWDLIAIGTLEPRKNQRYLLQIVAACQHQGRPITLAIAGDGPDADILRREAVELGLADRITFLGRVAVAYQQIPYAHFLIHVAKLENLPIALIESLAWGVPILAASVGGIPEIVVDGHSGAVVPLDNAEVAARIVIQNLDDHQRRAQMALAARAHYERSFQQRDCIRQLESILWPQNTGCGS